MSLPVDTVVSAALIISVAYTIYGLTGFGSSITAMPLLVIFMPLKLALPTMLALDLLAGLLVGLRNQRFADRRELVRLVPYMIVGMGLGVTVLVHAPEDVLRLALGIFILFCSAWSLIVRPREQLLAAGWSAAFGIGGGMFTALFGTGGPIYTIYLTRRLPDKVVLRATTSLLVLAAGLLRLVFFSSVGLFSQSGLVPLILSLLPCSLLGLVVGSRLHRHMQPQRVMQVVWLILMLAGLSLVGQGLARVLAR